MTTATTSVVSTKLNPVQLHLLHLFSRQMTPQELLELKAILVDWYDRKAQEEMDKIWEERGMSHETMDNILQSHFRSPYKK